MPRPIPAGLRLGVVEPRQAVAAFERRDLLLPSFRWQDVWQEEHARGVAVAGIMRQDLLQLFADELAQVVAAKSNLRQFRDSIQPALEKAGFWGDVEITDPVTGEKRITRFNDRRLRLIYDVNLRGSQAAGQWERIEATKAIKPLIMYRTMRDEFVRASHRPWDGLVLPVDAPFWQTHFPPNGWRCRCKAFAVSEKDVAAYKAAGYDIKREAPAEQLVEFVNRRTGSIEQIPRGVDPGFAWNPGRRTLAPVVPKELEPGEVRLPPPRKVPADMLLPPGRSDQDSLQAFMDEFGGGSFQEFTDVAGEQLVISDELFRDIRGTLKIRKRGREQFVRMLALAIREPDEIWMATEMHQARQAEVLRRRYIARFELEGAPRPVIGVFEIGKDGWRGVTGYQAENADSVEAVLGGGRRGALVYRRKA